jgi:RNA polymerase sigma factor (TIGR02999 family)
MGSGAELPGEITLLLRRWGSGDPAALGELANSAYDELRKIAARYMRREAVDHTLQATAVVNELYLRLARQRHVDLTDRRHFFAFAAMMMRRILSDHARQSMAEKRAGTPVPLHPGMAWVDAAGPDILTLDHALLELEALDERKARVIEFRYFLGCTNEETAELLGIARATVDRDLQFATSWLHRRMHPGAGVTTP